jgi:hypothetical protein
MVFGHRAPIGATTRWLPGTFTRSRTHGNGQPKVSMDYRLHTWDRYNWDAGKATDITDGINVTDAEMTRLHRVGLAARGSRHSTCDVTSRPALRPNPRPALRSGSRPALRSGSRAITGAMTGLPVAILGEGEPLRDEQSVHDPGGLGRRRGLLRELRELGPAPARPAESTSRARPIPVPKARSPAGRIHPSARPAPETRQDLVGICG